MEQLAEPSPRERAAAGGAVAQPRLPLRAPTLDARTRATSARRTPALRRAPRARPREWRDRGGLEPSDGKAWTRTRRYERSVRTRRLALTRYQRRARDGHPRPTSRRDDAMRAQASSKESARDRDRDQSESAEPRSPVGSWSIPRSNKPMVVSDEYPASNSCPRARATTRLPRPPRDKPDAHKVRRRPPAPPPTSKASASPTGDAVSKRRSSRRAALRRRAADLETARSGRRRRAACA